MRFEERAADLEGQHPRDHAGRVEDERCEQLRAFSVKGRAAQPLLPRLFFHQEKRSHPCVYRQYRAAAAKAAAFGNLPADGRGVCQPETGERIAGKRSHRSAVC